MKKVLAMILALVMALSLVACSNGGTDKPDDNTETKKIKVGFITLHDENSTYDLNFINAAKEACQTLGLVENEDYFIKKNVPEGQECYNAAAELAEQGCNIIFADSFGHESFMIEAAKEFPNVQFCHSTGVRAHTEGLSNYHNAFASIYEGRYLAGIAAGMKLNQMIAEGKITADKAKMGYVGAFTYAEVISGYTSFFLGARSVCPTATMEVTFTGSWSPTAASSSASTLTPWAPPPPARRPVCPTCPTTAPPFPLAPTPTSSPPALTGLPTMSTPSRLLWTARPSTLTGPAPWPPSPWFCPT